MELRPEIDEDEIHPPTETTEPEAMPPDWEPSRSTIESIGGIESEPLAATPERPEIQKSPEWLPEKEPDSGFRPIFDYQIAGDVGEIQQLTAALDQLETTSVGRPITESLRTSQTTIEFGPTKDSAVAEYGANTITISDHLEDASPAVLAAHLAHEGTHQRLGTPSSFADALDQEYRCHVAQAETWNALKDAEHDDQCNSVAEMVARGEAAAKAELLRRYGSAYFAQWNS